MSAGAGSLVVVSIPVAPPAGRPARLVVLVSGGGSNLAALLEACADGSYGAEVVGRALMTRGAPAQADHNIRPLLPDRMNDPSDLGVRTLASKVRM